MAVAISIGFTPESSALLAQWDGTSRRLVDELDRAFVQFVNEAESSIKANELSGTPGSKDQVGVRSGALRQAVTGEVDKPLGGFVGTNRGTTTPYARAILGPDKTTITPKRAKHLWVPVAANLTPSGIARYTPRALFDTFGDRVKIFESKKGNTVVFVEDPKTEGGGRATYKKTVYQNDGRVSRQGDAKGKLYFVLKDQVVIEGTDALAKGVQRMMPRGQQLLADAIARAIPGGAS
jgi:hypothetical protein